MSMQITIPSVEKRLTCDILFHFTYFALPSLREARTHCRRPSGSAASCTTSNINIISAQNIKENQIKKLKSKISNNSPFGGKN